MSQKSLSLAYIITIWLLSQLLIEINCQTTPFKPVQRLAHTSTLINDKLYIIGGTSVDNNNIVGKDFFYLDFSVAFDTSQNLSWQDLTSKNIVPPHYGATAVKGGANNNTLFLYGGFNSTSEMGLLYTFDPQSESWSIPTISGARGANLAGITDNQGKMYLWGGLREIRNDDANDMLILDTINLNWKIGNLVGAPDPRQNYGAVLLPNNNIIYMGGYNIKQNVDLTLNQVYIYDTINDKWSTQNTAGIIPSAREGFSAVLGLDGQKIIIFGGATVNKSVPLKPEDSLYVLDLNNYNFRWYVPKVNGQVPNSRMYHEANVIGKYMVISFGNGYNQSTENDILLLDISNDEEYIWTKNFELNTSITSPTPKPRKPLNNSRIMIGAAIGAFFGGLLLSLGAFLLYKWRENRRRQREIVLIMPGNEDKHDQEDLPVISIGKTRFSIANNERTSKLYKQ